MGTYSSLAVIRGTRVARAPMLQPRCKPTNLVNVWFSWAAGYAVNLMTRTRHAEETWRIAISRASAETLAMEHEAAGNRKQPCHGLWFRATFEELNGVVDSSSSGMIFV